MAENHFYLKLIEDINHSISSNDMESCFEQLKIYIQHNYEGRASNSRINEVIQHQRSYSSVRAEIRQGKLEFSDSEIRLSNIAKNILDFLETLKPAELDVNFKKIELANFEYWNYEDNLEARLIFPKEYGLLIKVFEKFIKTKREEGSIRVDRYFFNGRRKILIVDDSQYDSLEEEEQRDVVFEPMEWGDAIIFQKRGKEGVVLAEAFVMKESAAEEIKVRTNGMTAIDRATIFFEVVNWFKNVQTYPTKMEKPFTTQIPFHSLTIFDMLSTSSTDQKTITIFLASSYELKEDRKEFEILIGRENKRLNSSGVFLNLEIWEDFIDAMSKTRLQDEYNKVISQCDIFVSLFFTKVGKYTEEEFETALKQLKTKDKPFIYTYFKDADIKTGSLNDDMISLLTFREKLKSLGHFPSTYESIDDLKYKFKVQLDKILPQIKK